MTNSEAFVKMANHLLTQNRKSIGDLYCCYRGPDGLKCAVGALIPDEEYSLDFESFDINGLLSQNKIPSSLSKLNINLLIRVQRIHDHYQPEKWLGCLHDVISQGHSYDINPSSIYFDGKQFVLKTDKT